MAAAAFVSAGAATSGGGSSLVSAQPAIPAGLIDGDLVVAVVFWANRAGSGIVSSDAGWTTESHEPFNPAGTTIGDGVLAVLSKPWAAGMAVPTFLCSGGASTSTYIAQCIGIRGANLTSRIDVASAAVESAAGSTSVTIPDMTTLGADRLLLILGAKFALNSSGGTSLDQGGVFLPATLISATQATAGDDATLAMYHRTVAAAGAVGATRFTISGTAAYLLGKQLAIKPLGSDIAILPTFYDPAELETMFWDPVVSKASDLLVTPTFLDTAEEFYAPTIVLSGITPDFLDSQTEFYTATVQVITPSGEPEQPVLLQRFSADVFPPGTIVTIHEDRRAWPDRAPTGAPLSMSMVDALGRFEASGLTDGKWYAAYGVVEGRHRYLRFRFEASPS